MHNLNVTSLQSAFPSMYYCSPFDKLNQHPIVCPKLTLIYHFYSQVVNLSVFTPIVNDVELPFGRPSNNWTVISLLNVGETSEYRREPEGGAIPN